MMTSLPYLSLTCIIRCMEVLGDSTCPPTNQCGILSQHHCRCAVVSLY